MSRTPLVICLALLLAPPLRAQNPIQWSGDLRGSVMQSQATLRPLLFHLASTDRGGDNDFEDAQRRAFRDPAVSALARQRFTPVRLMRTNETEQMLRHIGAPVWFPLALLVVAPDGTVIGSVRLDRSVEPAALAGELARQFRKYRQQLFDQRLKPVLTDDKTPVRDLRRALGIIREFTIEEAADAVVLLLDRPKLSRYLRQDVYDTLALLSTEKATQVLLDEALENRGAAAALGRATPQAAEYLLDALDPEDQTRLKVAYAAIVRICAVKGARPERFWEQENRALAAEEIERVRQIVATAATRWRETTALVR